MRLSKTLSILCASAALGIGAPAAAQSQTVAQGERTQITVGTAVKHTSGAVVGTVQAIEPGFYIVKTDKHEVRLPTSAFTPHKGALLFAMTQAELNAQVEAAEAKAQAQIMPGAAVRGASGAVVATIDAIDEQFVTLKLTSGELVKLPKNGVAAGPQGPLIGMTDAELRTAAGIEPAGSAGGSATAAAASGASGT